MHSTFQSSDTSLQIPLTLRDEVALPEHEFLSPAFVESVTALGNAMEGTSILLIVILSISQCFV